MKKFLLLLVVVIALIVSACSSGQQVESVTMYKMTSFSDADLDSVKEITDPDEIATIQAAIKNAVKQPGIVNMADPEFMIEAGEQSYYLWIEEETGTIMNVEDTHTIYSLEKKNAKEVEENRGSLLSLEQEEFECVLRDHP